MARLKTLSELAQDIVDYAAGSDAVDRIYRVRLNHGQAVREIAEDVLEPHVPDDFMHWWLPLPRYRESVRQYARRVVDYAARKALKCGGLVGVSE